MVIMIVSPVLVMVYGAILVCYYHDHDHYHWFHPTPLHRYLPAYYHHHIQSFHHHQYHHHNHHPGHHGDNELCAVPACYGLWSVRKEALETR